MKRKIVLLSVSLLLAISIVVAGCAPVAESEEIAELEAEIAGLDGDITGLEGVVADRDAEIAQLTAPPVVYEWNLQSAFAAGTVVYDTTLPAFADDVRALTDGQIDITIQAPGAIVSTFATMGAVGEGALDMHLTIQGYFAGMVPAFNVISGYWAFALAPGGNKLWQQDALIAEGGALLELNRELSEPLNVYPLAMFGTVTYGQILSTVPITRLADVDGLKIRSFPPAGQILEEFGASITITAGAEQYSDLATGVLDAVTYGGASFMLPYGLQEVAKYMTLPAFYSSGMDLAINLDLWEALPDNLQNALKIAAAKLAYDSQRLGFIAEEAAMKTFVEDWGVTITTLPDEDLAAAKVISMRLLDETAAADADAGRAIAIIKAWMAELGLLD